MTKQMKILILSDIHVKPESNWLQDARELLRIGIKEQGIAVDYIVITGDFFHHYHHTDEDIFNLKEFLVELYSVCSELGNWGWDNGMEMNRLLCCLGNHDLDRCAEQGILKRKEIIKQPEEAQIDSAQIKILKTAFDEIVDVLRDLKVSYIEEDDFYLGFNHVYSSIPGVRVQLLCWNSALVAGQENKPVVSSGSDSESNIGDCSGDINGVAEEPNNVPEQTSGEIVPKNVPSNQSTESCVNGRVKHTDNDMHPDMGKMILPYNLKPKKYEQFKQKEKPEELVITLGFSHNNPYDFLNIDSLKDYERLRQEQNIQAMFFGHRHKFQLDPPSHTYQVGGFFLKDEPDVERGFLIATVEFPFFEDGKFDTGATKLICQEFTFLNKNDKWSCTAGKPCFQNIEFSGESAQDTATQDVDIKEDMSPYECVPCL